MSFSLRPAAREDNPAILALLARNAQPGQVSLAFERKPDYFHGAHISCEQPDVYVLEHADADPTDPGRVCGVFNIGSRTVYVDGEPQCVRYAHDLRLDAPVRGGKALFACYSILPGILQPGEWMQGVILADNGHFLASTSKPRPGMPKVHGAGIIETSLIFGRPSRRSSPQGLEIRQAKRTDFAAMQAFVDREGRKRQFFPRYQFSELGANPYYRALEPSSYSLVFRQGELIAIAGVWDQSGFRQTRVVGYSPLLRVVRPFYNAWGKVSGGMALPATGGCFSYLMMHTLLVRDQDPAIFRPLLDYMLRAYGPYYDALVCGLFTDDPLMQTLGRYRRRSLQSCHFLITQSHEDRPALNPDLPPYVDVARL